MTRSQTTQRRRLLQLQPWTTTTLSPWCVLRKPTLQLVAAAQCSAP